MRFILLSMFIMLMPLSSNAASKPVGVEFPPAPEGAPNSDCEQLLKDWDFAEEIILSENKQWIFLFVDRYGGKRSFPDFRGTMCRARDMNETWALFELFPSLKNSAFTEDGKYFVNAIGNVACGAPEEIDRLEELEVLVFHKNGTPVKGYIMGDLLPSWKEVCSDKGRLQWLSSRGNFKSFISEEFKSFTIKTSDGNTHYFNIKDGSRIKDPQKQ